MTRLQDKAYMRYPAFNAYLVPWQNEQLTKDGSYCLKSKPEQNSKRLGGCVVLVCYHAPICLITTTNKAELRLMGMFLDLHVFGHKPKH